MPGVLQIEAMAQAGGILASARSSFDPTTHVMLFMAIDAVKFRKAGRAGRPAPHRGRAAAQGQDLQDEGRDQSRRPGRVIGGVPGRARGEDRKSHEALLVVARCVLGSRRARRRRHEDQRTGSAAPVEIVNEVAAAGRAVTAADDRRGRAERRRRGRDAAAARRHAARQDRAGDRRRSRTARRRQGRARSRSCCRGVEASTSCSRSRTAAAR